ncbi:MAG: NAD(P)-dependent oxidoreductase [Actinomycetota bacterium]|nr:NAD(P)-dependent oxidoreductase [Actinomycetota bacterium]
MTGGAGFIGYHLAKNLVEHGYRVDLVDNLARGVRDTDLEAVASLDSVRLLDRDLLTPDSLADASTDYFYIFHLAAIVGVAHVLSRPYAVLHDNATMLASAIDCARRQEQLHRLVFTSTSEVYAGTLQHFGLPLPTPESTPLALPDLGEARTCYMLSKIYGEAACHHAGVPFTILRPHNVYGPRMGLAHVVPELLQRAHEAVDNDVFEVFSIEHRRTFCYVDDAVEILRRAAESSACDGQTLNLGVQAPEIPIRELAELVLDVVGKRLRIVAAPDAPGSPPRRCPDMRRTTELTSYEPRIPLREGVERTYAWYGANVFAGSGVFSH